MLQKAVFHSAKGGLLSCKTWPFALPLTAYRVHPQISRITGGDGLPLWMMHVDGRNVRLRRQIYFGVTHILYTFASMLKNILIVAVGGAVGSVARYLLSRLVQGTVLSAFPLGTMAVNVAGCLLIGLVCGLSAAAHGGLLRRTDHLQHVHERVALARQGRRRAALRPLYRRQRSLGAARRGCRMAPGQVAARANIRPLFCRYADLL